MDLWLIVLLLFGFAAAALAWRSEDRQGAMLIVVALLVAGGAVVFASSRPAEPAADGERAAAQPAVTQVAEVPSVPAPVKPVAPAAEKPAPKPAEAAPKPAADESGGRPVGVWPPGLKQGDTIAVVAPAGPVKPGQLDKGVAALRKQGYKVAPGRNVRAQAGFLAGSDQQRLDDLQRAWLDPAVDAVWCARGGYGSMRLLPRLDWAAMAKRPKPLIGYSDITALQMALYAKTGLISFSGPMVASDHGWGGPGGINQATQQGLWRWLKPFESAQSLGNVDGRPLRVIQGGKGAGPLLGGNLSCLVALAGTPYFPSFNRAVLVLEETNEDRYRVDRMLAQLKLAGVFDQVSAVVIGSFTNCGGPGPSPEQLIVGHVGGRSIPIVAGLVYGHVDQRATLPLGAWVEVDTSGPKLTVRRDPPSQ